MTLRAACLLRGERFLKVQNVGVLHMPRVFGHFEKRVKLPWGDFARGVLVTVSRRLRTFIRVDYQWAWTAKLLARLFGLFGPPLREILAIYAPGRGKGSFVTRNFVKL